MTRHPGIRPDKPGATPSLAEGNRIYCLLSSPAPINPGCQGLKLLSHPIFMVTHQIRMTGGEDKRQHRSTPGWCSEPSPREGKNAKSYFWRVSTAMTKFGILLRQSDSIQKKKKPKTNNKNNKKNFLLHSESLWEGHPRPSCAFGLPSTQQFITSALHSQSILLVTPLACAY